MDIGWSERGRANVFVMPMFEVSSIGTVRNERTDIQHTDNWGAVRSTIAIDERFGEASLQGLEGFSHVEVLFVFDQSRMVAITANHAPIAAVPTSRPSACSPAGVLAGRTATASRAAPSSPSTVAS